MYRQRTLLTAGSQRTRRTSRRTEMSNVFANHPSGEDSARHARCPVQEAVLPSSSRVRCSCRAGSTRSRERSRSPQRLGSAHETHAEKDGHAAHAAPFHPARRDGLETGTPWNSPTAPSNTLRVVQPRPAPSTGGRKIALDPIDGGPSR